MTLRPDQLVEYRELLTEVNRLAQEDLVRLWRSLESLGADELWASLRAGVPEVVELYRATAADTATLFYSETQGINFNNDAALAASQLNREQVDASLRWAVFAPGNVETLALISGIVQKHVVDGARQYGMDGFAKAGSGWHRAARPGACEFCRLLATRAATDWAPYSSAEAAVAVGAGKGGRPKWHSQVSGSEFHDHCMCIPVKASEYEVPDYVERWTAEYYAATEVAGSTDLRGVLKEMRKVA